MDVICGKVYPILECIAKNNGVNAPLVSSVVFAGACYALNYPTVRKIFKRRFHKRLLKVLLVGLGVGGLVTLLVMLAAVQTRWSMCRLLRISGLGKSNLQSSIGYIVCFNMILAYLRSKLLKFTYGRVKDMVEYFRFRSRKSAKYFSHHIKVEPKITRSGTIYG